MTVTLVTRCHGAGVSMVTVLFVPESGDGELGPSDTSRVRVMHVKHTEGPVDGSLYATVTKGAESASSSTRQESQSRQSSSSAGVANGPGSLHNGPLTHSADSGISSTQSQGWGSSIALTIPHRPPLLPPNLHPTTPCSLLTRLLSDHVFLCRTGEIVVSLH